MNSALWKKLKESAISVFPIILIVIVLNLTSLTNFSTNEMIIFVVSAIFLILGIAFFNIGANLAMTPMGEHIGSGLIKLRSLFILLTICFTMGILITVAEPDLTVLANQVSNIINPTALIITVGVGVALLLVIAIIKILTRKSLSSILMFFYMLMFAAAAVLIESGNNNLIPMAFDSGGVTTGPITVPFIMALGVGIATSLGGKNSSENSFGLIALCSVGPILAVLILGCTVTGDMPAYDVSQYMLHTDLTYLIKTILTISKEVAIALGLIIVFFAALQIAVLKLSKGKLIQISMGIVYTFVGLVIFLSAVKIGFMPIGYKLGAELAENKTAAIIISLVMGLVVVLAEPAVQVLNKQIEEITEGTVSRRSMSIALCIGVGLAICLSIVRIIFNFNILFYLIPGYVISLGLSFFVPKLYTAIAFDSGGVASGPLTSSFILPFAVGVCAAVPGGANNILSNAFGIVAMVAMAPLITIQLLGFRSVVKKKIEKTAAMKRILSADDEQIINFM